MSEETKEEIKNEKVDEEVTEELTEEALEDIVEEEINELDEAQKLATEWENKFLRVSAEMQNVQRRGNEERLQLIKYRSQDLAKKILSSLDNLERALAVEGLTDDVKKGLEMVQESLISALKEEGVEEVSYEVSTIIFTWLFKLSQLMMNIQLTASCKFSKKVTNFTNVYFVQQWLS